MWPLSMTRRQLITRMIASAGTSTLVNFSATPAAPTSLELTRDYYCTAKLSGEFDNTHPGEMAEAVTNYLTSNTKTLAIFFHGGLVNRDEGMKTATNLLNWYGRPDDLGGQAYPYFFIWESGFSDTLKSVIGRETSLKPLVYPAVVRQHVETRITQHRDHGDETAIEESLRDLPTTRISFAVPIQRLWREMQDGTERAFSGPGTDPFAPLDRYVGAHMVKTLLSAYSISRAWPRITLIGHSTGAVYICNFLKYMHRALTDVKYQDRLGLTTMVRDYLASAMANIQFDVIFIAPAVRIANFAETFYLYHDLIRDFRSFGMSDGRESSAPTTTLLDQLFASIGWHRSLLYFVSGVCEQDADTPLFGMQRFMMNGAYDGDRFGRIDNINPLISYLAAKHRTIWASEAAASDPDPGRQCDATNHGGFPEEDKTRNSVCYLLRGGAYE